jgi:uncharacterized membrane protein YhaH (DUF805 family)
MFIKELFIASGRLNRAAFYLNMAVIFAITLVAFFILNSLAEMGPFGRAIAPFLAILITIVVSCLCVFQIIKRLHDLDRSGWDYFFFAIPFYNIYLAAVVLFAPGTVGVNNYGQDPLGK